MKRRDFFSILTAGAIMTAEGLWVPGKKIISIPNPPNFMLSESSLETIVIEIAKNHGPLITRPLIRSVQKAGGVIRRADFSKMLADNLNEAFSIEYGRMSHEA